MTQVTHGGNVQSPSFSAGAVYHVQQENEFSCEIFIMDLYSGQSWQLTDNDICDCQPKWGK